MSTVKMFWQGRNPRAISNPEFGIVQVDRQLALQSGANVTPRLSFVTPAEAGVQVPLSSGGHANVDPWMPASACMTIKEACPYEIDCHSDREPCPATFERARRIAERSG